MFRRDYHRYYHKVVKAAKAPEYRARTIPQGVGVPAGVQASYTAPYRDRALEEAMNIVRLDFTHAGIAEFTVDYGKKRALIRLEGTGTTGGPEEDGVAWEPFYRERLEELFTVIQAEGTHWTSRGSE